MPTLSDRPLVTRYNWAYVPSTWGILDGPNIMPRYQKDAAVLVSLHKMHKDQFKAIRSCCLLMVTRLWLSEFGPVENYRWAIPIWYSLCRTALNKGLSPVSYWYGGEIVWAESGGSCTWVAPAGSIFCSQIPWQRQSVHQRFSGDRDVANFQKWKMAYCEIMSEKGCI